MKESNVNKKGGECADFDRAISLTGESFYCFICIYNCTQIAKEANVFLLLHKYCVMLITGFEKAIFG